MRLLPLLLLLPACWDGREDPDMDGLTNDEEALYGTDPYDADTDDDGLSDFADIEAGASPLEADTDGDSYLDLWEVVEGTDPGDPDSRIYTGFWSYNPDKSGLRSSVESERATLGAAPPAFEMVDQFGQAVELHDLIGVGKPTVVSVCAMWCPPCVEVAAWLANTDDAYNLEEAFPTFRQAVNDGEIQYISVLVDGPTQGIPPTPEEIEAWLEQHGNPMIPELTGTESAEQYLRTEGYPTFHYIGPTGTFEYLNSTSTPAIDFRAFERAVEALEES